MREFDYQKIMLLVYNEYKDEMGIYFIKENRYFSVLEQKSIYISTTGWLAPTEWSTFALLHEIGHVKTNKIRMRRCVQEYLATQWAIDKAKEINLPLSNHTLDVYQTYIWKWMNTRAKHNIVTKDELKLIY